MAQCFPSLEEILRFRNPLEPGERHLVERLVELLPDEHEVYVQPFLNGDRPDVVVLMPDRGVLIIEVKDWNLSHYRVTIDDDHRRIWRLNKNNARVRSPLRQVKAYKENCYNLHIDTLLTRKIADVSAFSLVGCAVYFHGATKHEARSLAKPQNQYVQILGCDSLTEDGLSRALVKLRLHRERPEFDESIQRSFRRYLQPPVHSPDEGIDITYTSKQKGLTESQAGAKQKVRGVAGCGKTLVLAKRAVNAHKRTEERVLILTFNISLRNYIHDRISEVRERFSWDQFHILHYHQFFKSEANNYELEYDDLLTAADDTTFFEDVEDDIARYDVILIDEVQDYKSEWIRILRKYFLTEEEGELVLFGDEKQNVYQRELDEQKRPNTTIPGRWNELNESFRLNDRFVELAQAFQKQFYEAKYELDEGIEVQQQDLFGEAPHFEFVRIDDAEPDEIFEAARGFIKRLDVHPNNVTILSPIVEPLPPIVQLFNEVEGERTTLMHETVDELRQIISNIAKPEYVSREVENLRRKRKFQFRMNPGTLKSSTIHSFKGWEIDTLIIVLTEEIDNEAEDEELFTTDELIYTAITRCRQNLLVISAGDDRYDAFFRQHCDRTDAAAA